MERLHGGSGAVRGARCGGGDRGVEELEVVGELETDCSPTRLLQGMMANLSV